MQPGEVLLPFPAGTLHRGVLRVWVGNVRHHHYRLRRALIFFEWTFESLGDAGVYHIQLIRYGLPCWGIIDHLKKE